MKKNNGKKTTNPFLNPQYKRYDLTNPDNYEGDYPDGDFRNNVEKIYELPAADDMPGVFLRGIFKTERQVNACLRLMYRHKKFGDIDHQELLRAKVAATAAMNGISRLDALFAAVNLLASDMYRTARGMPRLKKGEEERVIRGSDFRREERPQEPSQGYLR